MSKFKFGDEVVIHSDFYGDVKGTVTDKTKEGKMEQYCVSFYVTLNCVREVRSDWFNPKELEAVK